MNTLNKHEHGPPSDQNDNPNQITPIRVYVVFRNPEQAELFEKLLRRITRADLHALLFPETDVNALLAAVGSVRAPLKGLRVGAENVKNATRMANSNPHLATGDNDVIR